MWYPMQGDPLFESLEGFFWGSGEYFVLGFNLSGWLKWQSSNEVWGEECSENQAFKRVCVCSMLCCNKVCVSVCVRVLSPSDLYSLLSHPWHTTQPTAQKDV